MGKNKFFISSLAVAVAVSSSGVSAGAAFAFSDVSKNNSHYDAIMELANRGIIHGYGDGTFRPGNAVTRGQAAKMIAGILGVKTGAVPISSFGDVPANNEYAGAIMALKQLGAIDSDTSHFRPKDPISRNELAIILTRALNLQADESVKLPFTDVNKAFETAVAALYQYGITKGTTETTFGGNATVTRGQLATFIVRAEKIFTQKPVEETAEQATLVVEAIEKETLQTANETFKISKALQPLLNEANKESLTGAKIQAKVVNGEIVSVTALELNASGTEEIPVTFDGGNAAFEGEMTINADFVELRNVKIAGDVILTNKAITTFETNQVTVTGDVIVEDTVINPVASFTKIANSSTTLTINFKGSSIARFISNRANTHVYSDQPLRKVILQGNAKDNMINADINELILRVLNGKLIGTGTIQRLEIPETPNKAQSKKEFELQWKGTINELSILDAFVQILISNETKISLVILPNGVSPNAIFKNLMSLLKNFGKFTQQDGKVITVQDNLYEYVPNDAYVPPVPAPTPTGLGATAVTAAGNDGTITGTKVGQEYRKQGSTAWTDVTGTTVTALEAGTYEIRVKATATSLASAITTVTVNAYVPVPAPTPTGLGATAVTAAGNDGTITGTEPGQEYRKQGETTWTNITGPTVTGLEAGTYEVRVKATATSLASAITTVTVYAYVPAPTGLNTTAVTATGNDGTITGTKAGQEYREQGETTWTDITGPTVTGLEAGTYEVRVKATATSLASAITTVTVNAYVPAPTGLNTTAVTAAGNDGTITGTELGQEYRKQGDSTWIDVTGTTVTGLEVGTYEVRVKATATSLVSAITTVTVNAYVPAPIVSYDAIEGVDNTEITAVGPTVAAGSTQPIGYAVKANSTLPAGLSLDATTGVITGTPTKATAETVTIEVSYIDGNGTTATTDVTVSITITPQQK